MYKKILCILLIFCLALFTGACSKSKEDPTVSNAPKDDYPNKPIEVIVPYSAGGGTDTAARILQSVISEYLPNKQSIVVINEPSGSGTVGCTKVANSKPDGYTLLLSAGGALLAQPHYEGVKYSLDDLTPIIRISSAPTLIAVRSNSNIKSFEDLIAAMKDKKGKFSFGATGIGSTAHVSLLAFCAAGGLECTYVPYDGGSEAMLAMLGGEIDAVVGGSQQILGQLKSGDIRIVANIGTTRSESYKDVPFATEMGINSGSDTLNGLLGPAGMDPKIVTIIHDAFKAALEDKRVIEAMNAAGIEIAYANPEDFKKVLYSMSKDYGVILKQLGLIK